MGGAPVVAKRQAVALAELGHDVNLLDVTDQPGAEAFRRDEAWMLDEAKVTVESWVGPFAQRGTKDTKCSEITEILRLAVGGVLLNQESWCVSLMQAAKSIGLKVVLQPNDYSFMCGRTWLLKGDGKQCSVNVGPKDCWNCQVNGRTILETLALHALSGLEAMGIPGPYPKIRSLQKNASARIGDLGQLLSLCDGFIAQSKSMREVLRHIVKDDSRILHVNYGAVPPGSKFKPKEASEEVHFAYIARPSYEKGLHVLLEAWALLDEATLKKSRLTLYAPLRQGPAMQRKRIANLLKKCRKVAVTDIAVSPRLDEVYSEIDCAVQPSLWIDHNTQTILEARARGIPVIIPKHTSFADDIVFDGVDGLLIDRASSECLNNALARLVNEPDLLARIKHNPPYGFSDKRWAEAVLHWLDERSFE